MPPFDPDITHYTFAELLAILQLQDTSTFDDMIDATENLIQKYYNEGNAGMMTFFQGVQDRLSQEWFSVSPQDDDEEGNGNNNNSLAIQTELWDKNQVLTQSSINQVKKITQRKRQTEVYEDDVHYPMKREQLGVNDTFTLPVKQDTLNPNLKNVTEIFMNLDSQFRQAGTLATDFTLDLSDHLKDVVSLRLYSFQIPVSWYTIDVAYGNTCFWVQNVVAGTSITTTVPISIAPGNYGPSDIVSALNVQFNAQFTPPVSASIPWLPSSYDTISGKISVNLVGASYTNPIIPSENFVIKANETQLTFFDPTFQLQCASSCGNASYYVNQTLGWILGFREKSVVCVSQGNTGEAVLDLIGPKYLILVLDDLNQNHINSGLVGITELSTQLKVPSYFSADLAYQCVANAVEFQPPVQEILPSYPRTLTQSQIYTLNQILKNNERTTNHRAKAPTNSDTFAVIPIKGGLILGQLYTDFGGSLQNFKRQYFGPVNIDRMRVRLLDDKGNLLNLNGLEWSITLICELLYQY